MFIQVLIYDLFTEGWFGGWVGGILISLTCFYIFDGAYSGISPRRTGVQEKNWFACMGNFLCNVKCHDYA